MKYFFIMRKILSEEEKKKIQKAVEDAEKQTSGEIVPYLVSRSDFYLEAIFKSALIFNISTLIILYSFAVVGKLPDFFEIQNVLYIVFCATLLGIFVGYIPFFRRIFAGKSILHYRVQLKAWEAFVEREVFKTKNRTGVLIFISFLERIVYVLGDSGINQKVKKEDWLNIVQTIIKGIKKNQLADGIVEAIYQCGELLKESGLAIEKGDINELSNEITER